MVLWASAFVGIRAAGEELSPGPLSLIRLLIGAVGFSTWAYALARTSAGRMGATTYLVPPLTILGWLLLSEAPPTLALLGGLMCLVGVAITRGRGL